jgi:hypothetical protein
MALLHAINQLVVASAIYRMLLSVRGRETLIYLLLATDWDQISMH